VPTTATRILSVILRSCLSLGAGPEGRDVGKGAAEVAAAQRDVIHPLRGRLSTINDCRCSRGRRQAQAVVAVRAPACKDQITEGR
jgi:hypothetical protein